MGNARARVRARFEGQIRRIRIQPQAAVPTLEIVFEDNTGRVSALFMGRRRIAGIECGAGWPSRGRRSTGTGG